MRANLISQIVKAHVAGDEAAFKRAVLQLAASESKAGHSRVAEELRAAVERVSPLAPQPARPTGQVVSMGQPRGEVSDLLEGGYCQERLRDIVLREDARTRFKRIIAENRDRGELAAHGLSATRRLLLAGPPGCGKTLAARVIAGELGMPLLTVRLDGLFSRFLGETAVHLKGIFDQMGRRPAVYFFDEFDAVGKHRGDQQEIGEVRRVVTSFLQLMDADRSDSLIVAATNHEELLDRALFRRFDAILSFEMPSPDDLRALIELRLAAYELDGSTVAQTSRLAEGLSFADVARACDDALRTAILERRTTPDRADLVAAFRQVRADRLRAGIPDGR